MTQEELRDRIDAIQSTKVVNLGKYNSIESWQEEKFLQLINRHVADVIGELENYVGDLRKDDDAIVRNELRATQRKRGGL